jgi:hypothetical protein
MLSSSRYMFLLYPNKTFVVRGSSKQLSHSSFTNRCDEMYFPAAYSFLLQQQYNGSPVQFDRPRSQDYLPYLFIVCTTRVTDWFLLKSGPTATDDGRLGKQSSRLQVTSART